MEISNKVPPTMGELRDQFSRLIAELETMEENLRAQRPHVPVRLVPLMTARGDNQARADLTAEAVRHRYLLVADGLRVARGEARSMLNLLGATEIKDGAKL